MKLIFQRHPLRILFDLWQIKHVVCQFNHVDQEYVHKKLHQIWS